MLILLLRGFPPLVGGFSLRLVLVLVIVTTLR
jgi:hypothetical protein